MTAAFLIVAALQNRSQTGEGKYIDVSLFDTAVLWMGYWITYYTGTGDVPAWGGQGFAGITLSEVFEVTDEEPFYLSAINDMLWRRLCVAIDRPDFLADDQFQDNES